MNLIFGLGKKAFVANFVQDQKSFRSFENGRRCGEILKVFFFKLFQNFKMDFQSFVIFGGGLAKKRIGFTRISL